MIKSEAEELLDEIICEMMDKFCPQNKTNCIINQCVHFTKGFVTTNVFDIDPSTLEFNDVWEVIEPACKLWKK